MDTQIANTIYSQIKAGVASNVIMSWGISKMFATTYNGMDSLMLRVSGFIHKGWVVISYNAGADYYEVHLLDFRKKHKKTETDVHCEELGAMIDHLVERPVEMEAKEYEKLVDNAKYKL